MVGDIVNIENNIEALVDDDAGAMPPVLPVEDAGAGVRYTKNTRSTRSTTRRLARR